MKVKKVSKKIHLNKSTVVNLTESQMEAAHGGFPVPDPFYTVGACYSEVCSLSYCTLQPVTQC